ncbi:MAG: hypothetical protein GC189_04790 [Alphaproteobacteria bacterium]|nr:hypothetical protein [Alphaproteobacteria bacterium]
MLGKAEALANVGISRPDAARAFYVDTLGLNLISEDEFAIVVSGSGAKVRLSKVPMVTPAAYSVLSFDVKDMAAFVKQAKDKGVMLQRFPFLPADDDGVWTSPDGARVCWIRDPDLNLIGVAQHP